MNEFHPKETLILEETTIRRERVLPPNAFGHVMVRVGEGVNPNKVVAEGELQQDFRIIDLAGAFDIKPSNVEALEEILAVSVGSEVQRGQPLAKAKRRRDRKKVPYAPDSGSVSLIENGRVILQINPKPIEILARMPGKVTEQIGDRGVRIETTGALIQCAWGNGRFAFASYAFEPRDGGITSLINNEGGLDNIRGRVFIIPRILTAQDIEAGVRLRVGGLVAPTMPYYLQDAALMVKFPIMLTDGFGKRRPTEKIFHILRSHERKGQAAFDAYMPSRWQGDRPEIIIPTPVGQYIAAPNIDAKLRVGAMVRLKRAPNEGVFAQITDLPDSPQLIDNGLRTLVARVKLENGNQLTIPLQNLELLGKS